MTKQVMKVAVTDEMISIGASCACHVASQSFDDEDMKWSTIAVAVFMSMLQEFEPDYDLAFQSDCGGDMHIFRGLRKQ